ncbi:MAG: hypothetical protein AAF702_22520 [Chloroflexota bacterium]
MTQPTNEPPGTLDRLTNAYQLLLYLYPASFRQTYGAEIVQVFRTCCHLRWKQGRWIELFLFSSHTLLDLLVTASQERWRSWLQNDEWERNHLMPRPIDDRRPFMEEVTTVMDRQPDYYQLFVTQIESLESVGSVADCLSMDGDLSDPDALFAFFQDTDEVEESAPRWLARLTSAVRQSLYDVSPGPSANVASQMIERIYANPALFELIAAEEVGQQLVEVVESLALDGNAEEIDEMLALMQDLGK